MERRQWKGATKAKEGSGRVKWTAGRRAVSHTPHLQSAIFQMAGPIFPNACRAFERPTPDQSMAHLQRENAQLKALIGELTVELKKIEVWG